MYSQDAGLFSALATSTMLTITVLIPFPLPSTCVCGVGEGGGGGGGVNKVRYMEYISWYVPSYQLTKSTVLGLYIHVSCDTINVLIGATWV